MIYIETLVGVAHTRLFPAAAFRLSECVQPCSCVFCPVVSVNQIFTLYFFHLKPVPPQSFAEKDSDSSPEGDEDADDKVIKAKVSFSVQNTTD